MGIFDNAKSITFNDKEVKSITVDGGVIYEKDEPTPTPSIPIQIHVTVKDTAMENVEGAEIILDDDPLLTCVTGSDGMGNMNIWNLGDYTAVVSKEGYETKQQPITVHAEGDLIWIKLTPSEPQVTTQ